MDPISTYQTFKNYLFLLLGVITLTVISNHSYAQSKNYATVTPSRGTVTYGYPLLGLGNVSVTPSDNNTNAASVVNPENASSATSTSPAAFSVSSFSLLGLGNEGEAWMQFKYGADLAAGKTTYVPFDSPTSTGISVDLLTLLGDITGLLSKQIVIAEAYSGAVSGTTGISGTKIADANVTTTIVRDGAGKNYFAITSAVPYNSVRIRLRNETNLLKISLGNTISLNIYTPFNNTADNCGSPLFASVGEATGLNVRLTTSVLNPERAVDGNPSTFSQLQPGLIGLGSSISQTFYLNGLSSATDVAKVSLSQPGSVLSVAVLPSIRVQAYNGTTPVGTEQSGTSLLGLDLLGLLTNNAVVPVYFTPGAPFDRIKVTINNALAVGGNILSGGLNINEVERTVAKPLFGGTLNGTLAVCGGNDVTLSVQNPNPGFVYNLYNDNNGTPVLLTGGNTTGVFTVSGLAPGTYTAYISAQKGGCTSESDKDKVVVTVQPLLVFGTATLPNAMVSAPYAKAVTAATGGTPATGTGAAPYTYALAAGSTLPAGLTITNGTISGTPTAAGTFNFSLTATDGAGCKKTAAYTLTVAAKLVFPTAVIPNGMVTKPYPATNLPVPTGGTGPYVYASSNLPAGLALDPATGIITGTPVTAGSYTFTVTVTDGDGNVVPANFNIIVRDLLALQPATLSDGMNGKIYPTQIIPPATGGSGVYAYSAVGLPAGLSFNPATREITGTPTATGTATVQVTVSDNEGNTATANYSLVVRDPLVLAAGALPDATVNVPYPVQTIPAAAGGVGPYTYLATNVPAGLTFDPVTRQLSGTPASSGNFTISVKVTDNANNTITVPYTLRVIGTLVLPTATLPGGTVGLAYTSPALPAVSGGTAPYIYSVTGLPAGLNFDQVTRVISGTPAAGGSFTATMTVKDGNNISTSTDYTLNINVGTPSVAGATICGGNPATLSVNNPVNGVTYNFYSSAGNTALGTGTTYNTGVLTQTTTFYAEAVSGTAVSARVPVVVTVNPEPALPVVATNSVTVTTGQTATLSATATAGSAVNWYAAATGGAVLSATGSFTTPALTANTTYYAAAVDNTTGCVSLTRVPVVISVTGVNAAANCNAANTQQSGVNVTLLCVGCAVNNPGNSTDADPANFTQLAIPVGLGASAYQQLIFQRPGVATDSVRLDLETPTGLLNLTALGGITVNILNGTTVVKSYPLNQSLINLQILTGNRFKATFAATGVYDRVEVRFSPVVSALSSVNIYGAQVIYPNPTVVSGNQTICSGGTAALQVTPVTGTSVVWYSDATGGTILSSQNTFTTPALTATTTYYIEVSKNGCANPTRVPVVVTVTPALNVPVLAQVSPVCAGSSAVLSVNTPEAGITYKWYAAATGGTALFTGPVYTTLALTGNTSFFVEASNGNCTSATRTEAAVTVNPLPALPQIQASATTVSSGQTVKLSATSTETGVTFNWYTSATSTTPVFTGPDYVTPPLTATTTYYVSATSTATGCASSSRVQVTITVSGPGTPLPALCEFPVSQTNGVNGGIVLLARVDNPELVLDGDQHTGSTLSIPVGALGGSIYQKVNFAGLSNVGDTVQIRLQATDRLLSLALLPNVTMTTFNGAASNNDGLIINNPLLNVQLLSGGAEALFTFVPTAQFDGVQVSLNSGVVGALTAINFNSARRIAQAATVDAAGTTVCTGSAATLTVTNPKPNIVYKWYDASGTYLGNDGTTFTTPAVTANTTFFVDATRGDCSGSRTTVNVNVVPAPVTPVLLSSDVATCSGSTVVLQVQNAQAGNTFNWYKDGVLVPAENTATLNIPAVTANAVYTVEAVNSCGVKSAQAIVNVNVGSLAAPVVTPPAVTINLGELAILTAVSSTAGVTYTWYTDPALTTIVSTPSNGVNGTYTTGLLTSSTTYYVTAEVPGGCVSAASSVVVTVNPAPTDPALVPCEAATVSLAVSTPLLTSVTNPELAVDDRTATSSSLFIAAGLVNTSVSQRVGFPGGTSLPGDQIKLGISSPAALLSLGVGQSISVTTYNNGISNGDTQVISNPLLNLQILTGNKDATVQFTPAKPFDAVELKLTSGLASVLTAINFNYAQRIQVPPAVASANVTVCQGATGTLAVSNPVAGITYNWSSDDPALIIPPGDTYTIPATLAAGTYNYYVTATRNGCPSAKTKVVVTVTPAPAPAVPSAGNPVTTCLNTPVILSVDQVSGVTYNWYDAAVNGNVLASNTNTYTTPVNLPAGLATFYVEAVNSNSCINPAGRTPVTITVNPAATAADVTVTGAENNVCAGGTAKLTAASTTVTNPVFTWYTDAALLNPVFTGAEFNINPVTATTTYYVAVSGSNKCPNTSGTGFAVTLQVNPPAVPADITVASSSTGACAGAVYTFTASAAGVTNPVFTWYSDAALTQVVPNLNSAVLVTPALSATTTYYVTVSGSNRCANVSGNGKAVTAVINPPADASDITVTGVPNSICSGSGAILTASSTTVTNPVFTWYSDAALTQVIPNGNSAVLTVPPLTVTTTYYVTVSGLDKCENTAATAKAVVLTVNPQLIFSDATLTAAAAASPYSVQLPSPTGGTAPYTYSLPAGSTLPDGLSLSAGGILSGTPVTAGTTTFALTAADSKNCNATANFTLTVNSALALPAANLPDGQVGTIYVTQTIPAATGGTSPYTYTATGVPAGLFFDPLTREITGTPAVGGNFPVTVTVTDAANRTATGVYTINVTVPAPVVANANTCPGTGVTLTVSNPITGVTYNWYANASGGTALNQGTTYQVNPSVTTTYYAEASSGTAVSARTAVTVTVGQVATAADIQVAGVPAAVCSGSGVSLTASSATVTNPVFTWYSDAALTQVVSNQPVLSIPALTQTATYYVTVSGLNTCANSAATAKAVVLTVNPAIVFNGIALPAGAVSSAYNVQLNPATGGTAPYTYSVTTGNTLPDGLSLSAGGLITGTPTTLGTYNFSLTAADNSGCAASANFSIVIGNTPPALNLPLANLPDGQVGTIYVTQTIPAATGGTSPYTYTATGMPPGLSFDPLTREISGTPSAGGNFPILVTVTDGANNTVTGTYTINVTVPAPVVANANTCPGTGVTLTVSNPITGVTYNWFANANGGTALNQGTTYQVNPSVTTTYYAEASSGTAVSARTAVTVTVGQAATAADIQVAGVPAAVCSGSGASLTASSGTVTNPVFTWYSDAALTQVVSNQPVLSIPALTQTTTYYVTVSGLNTCANSAVTAKAVVLTVNPAIVFNGIALPAGAVSSAYNVQLNPATGGTAPYTYSVTTGNTLPAGLSLSAAGLITGTPTTLGTYNFSLTAADNSGCAASANFSIVIGNTAPALNLPLANLPDGQVGTIYVTQTIPAATGGTSPYTYTATGVPPGLSFNPLTREISGTPSAGGSFPILVTVTDGANNTVTGTYTINVMVPAPVVANANTCSGTGVTLTVSNPITGVTYNWYANANGGTALNQGTTYQVNPSVTTTYYAEASSGTAVSARTAVTVTVGQAATAADIQVAGVPAAVCSGSGASLTASSGTVTNPVFTWYSDAALTQVVSNQPAFNTPVLTQNTTYYVTVSGLNTCANTAANAKVVILTVNPPLVFTGRTLPVATLASAYNVQLSPATGGTAPYTYSLTAGNALPTGITLSPAGLLSGIPAVPNTYTFSLTATDSKGCSAAADFTLTVGNVTNGTLSLPAANLPNGQVGTAYPVQTLPLATGGTTPYTYAATNVPAGLSFDPATRQITGTPATGGTYVITVAVTDASGLTAAQDYTITVTVPAPVAAAAQACAGSAATLAVINPVTGVTYNWYAAANGGIILYQGATFQTPAVNASTTYYVEGVSGTAISGRVAVSVTVASVLSSPVITVQSSTAMSITFAWNNVSGASGYEVSTDGGTTWVTPSSGAAGNTHTITGLQTNATVNILVRAVGSTVCQTSTAGRATGTASNGAGNDVFIPNTFTPNGDGKNDIFYVYGSSIAKVRMRIYNQWGQFIYESLQVQNGWDGTYKGQLQPNGVYVYYAELTFTDGTTALKKGSVTLLR